MTPTVTDKMMTPRKPLAVSNSGYGVCPRCENLVSCGLSMHHINSCKYCGQMLLWPEKQNGGKHE